MKIDKNKKIQNIIISILCIIIFIICVIVMIILNEKSDYIKYNKTIMKEEYYTVMNCDDFYNTYILDNKNIIKGQNSLIFTDSEERIFILNLIDTENIMIIDLKSPNHIIYLLFPSYDDYIKYTDLIRIFNNSYCDTDKQIYIQ